MKGKFIVIAAAMASNAAAFADDGKPKLPTINEIADRLDNVERYEAGASYSVLLPSASDEITYVIDLQSTKTHDDPLSACDYLIDWRLPTPSGQSSGFSAYADGSHYRYRDERLQEYHYDWDSIPFLTGRGGVQRNAQFVDILPQSIAAQLRTIATDSAYDYSMRPTSIDAKSAIAVDAIESRDGYTARELSYIFDSESFLPIKIDMENNPGAISEQTVTIEFSPAAVEAVTVIDEPALISRYPKIFERFRQSNFRVENLPGTMLPTFSLPTIDAKRYSRQKGDPFKAPTILVMIDPTVATATQTVEAVRSAVGKLPMTVDIIWAFTSNNIDLIEPVVGSALIGETPLMTARSLARDCGVSSFPTLIFVNRDSSIKDVALGFNKDLETVVIQKAALLER